MVGSSSPGWLIENIVLDSLLFLSAVPASARRIVDIGSGVGAPGVPVAVVRQDLDMTLVESRQRRASFLSTVVRELGLDNARVVADRAEALVGAGFDVGMARCAGRIDRVMGVARNLVRSGGVVIVSGAPGSVGLAGIEWRDLPGARPRSTRTLGVATVG
jgi:16S rRNA (guanine527-N7)-methyltransferase